MPKSSSQARAAVAAASSQTQQGAVVHVTLRFNGVTFSPVALYDALDAAYGTVSSDKDELVADRGTFEFTISP